MKKLFYDIEIFKHNTMIIILDENGQLFKEFSNYTGYDGLRDIVKNYVLIGYNNYHYDDKIISLILQGITSPEQLKNYSDNIIFNNYKINTSDINSLDAFQEISVAKPSLKKIQANKGYNIHETPISFNLDRELTEEEYNEVRQYCINDVISTIEVFNERQDYFIARKNINKMLGQNLKWNTTTLVGELFKGHDNYNGSIYKYIDNLPIFEDVKTFWSDSIKLLLNGEKLANNDYTHEEFGNVITFGFGGLHGINSNYHMYKFTNKTKLLHIDVASMYPSIIRNKNILGNKTAVYSKMIDDRISFKKSDKDMANTLKLILNKVYGVLNSEYNKLYNPTSLYKVVLFGQSVLYDLGKQLSQYSTVIQLNTDGVYIYVEEEYEKHILNIVKLWELDHDLKLEVEEYKKIIQRDVNNYITVDLKDNINVKGDLKKFKGDKFYENNSLGIVDLAIINKLVYNIDPLTTIIKNKDNLLLFQYIAQKSRQYTYFCDEDGNKLDQKINRLFAVKNGKSFYKVKVLDSEKIKDKIKVTEKKIANYKTTTSKGYKENVAFLEKLQNHIKSNEEYLVYELFANAPTSATVYNSDLKDCNITLDYNFYYKLALKGLKKYGN